MAGKNPRSAAGEKKPSSEQRPSAAELKEEIQATAQKIYETRQAHHVDGDEVSDWLEAEAQVKKRHKLD
jgi:hypothetical protein